MLRVVNVLPQVQVTVVSTYSGWMSFFTTRSLSHETGSAGRMCPGCREPVSGQVCQTAAHIS